MTCTKKACTLILGGIFVKSKHVQQFCEGMHTFYPNFRRFYLDSKSISRIFTTSNVLGVRLHLLHPCFLHQCKLVCYNRKTFGKMLKNFRCWHIYLPIRVSLYQPDMIMCISAWHNSPYVSILLNCKQQQPYGGDTVWMLAARMMAGTCYF